MELKKSKDVNLENKRGVFFFVGLVMTTAVVGMAFEYETFTQPEQQIVFEENDFEEELVYEIQEEEIIQEEPEVAPPPPVMPPDIEPTPEPVPDPDLTFIDVDPEPMPEPPEPVFVPEPIVDFAEVEPSFPGGEGAMAEWISDNIHYPEMSAQVGEQGIVYIQFVVNTDGSIEQVKTRRGVSDALDSEAKRVVKKMPKWTPGEQAGKPVRVRFTLPIHFKLG